MSFKIRYGDEPDEQVVFLEDRPVKMVGNVFKYRDVALRYTSKALVKVALLQPVVAKRAAGATAKTTKAASRGARLGFKLGKKLRGGRGEAGAPEKSAAPSQRSKPGKPGKRGAQNETERPNRPPRSSKKKKPK